MQEQLRLLILLQEVDKKLKSVMDVKGNLPERVKHTRHSFEQNEEMTKVREQQYKDLLVKKDLTAGEIKESEDRLIQLKNRLYEVNTNREYEAITSEIKSVEERIQDQENQLLELMEKEGQVVAEVEDLKSTMTSQQEELQEMEKELKVTEKSTEGMAGEQKELMEKIDKRMLANYTRIKNAKKGLGIVPVKTQFCGGCMQQIPPQKLVEVKLNEKILNCDSCGRILFWPDNYEEN